MQRTIEENCAGIECLAGIPGTVGGTPVQNVGAYGQEVSSTIDRVRAFDLGDDAMGGIHRARSADLRIGAAGSTPLIAARYVVTRVDYRLTPGGAPTLTLCGSAAGLCGRAHEPSLAEVAEAVRRIRQARECCWWRAIPDCRSAGSFFKNPMVDRRAGGADRGEQRERAAALFRRCRGRR